MDVSMVVVGYNEWDTLTVPLLESAKRTSPTMELVCVDNGSNPPYPGMDGVKMVRAEKEGSSYASALNLGVHNASTDWLVLVNNDVIIHKDIMTEIQRLADNVLYGFYVWQASEDLFTWSYLSSWCYIMHRNVFDTVGEFDEKCAPMFFEDADYCKRMANAHMACEVMDCELWGIEHLQGNRRMERNAYLRRNNEARNKIRDYVRGKHA